MVESLALLTGLPFMMVVLPALQIKYLVRDATTERSPSLRHRSSIACLRLASAAKIALTYSLFSAIWLAIFLTCRYAAIPEYPMLDPAMTGVIRFHQGDTLAVCFLSLALTALLLQMSTAPVLVIVANWNAPQLASLPASIPWFLVACYTAWQIFGPLFL